MFLKRMCAVRRPGDWPPVGAACRAGQLRVTRAFSTGRHTAGAAHGSPDASPSWRALLTPTLIGSSARLCPIRDRPDAVPARADAANCTERWVQGWRSAASAPTIKRSVSRLTAGRGPLIVAVSKLCPGPPDAPSSCGAAGRPSTALAASTRSRSGLLPVRRWQVATGCSLCAMSGSRLKPPHCLLPCRNVPSCRSEVFRVHCCSA